MLRNPLRPAIRISRPPGLAPARCPRSRRFQLLAALLILVAGAATPLWAAPGDLDPTFGISGVTTTDLPYAHAAAATLQADGRIVVVGSMLREWVTHLDHDLVVARYTRSGELDPSFGEGGVVTMNVMGNWDVGRDLVIQRDGNIVVAGGGYSQVYLVRFHHDGSLDTSFGAGGSVQIPLGGSPGAIALQADGKIVYAGSAGHFAMARYHHDGTLDPTFGTNGTVTTDIAGDSDSATTVGIQADGKIVVAGWVQPPNNPSFYTDVALVRYNPDGSLDTSFGTDGTVVTSFGTYDGAYDLAIAPDGKIVVAGRADMFYLLVARYTSEGRLDPTFGDGGKVVSRLLYGEDDASLLIQADGKILAAGKTDGNEPGYAFAVARYHPDGRLDTSFGNSGLVATDMGGDEEIREIVLQPDGRIVAFGKTHVDYNSYLALARYENSVTATLDFNANGEVDAGDLQMIADHWKEQYGDLDWQARFDVDRDWDVDVRDLMVVAAAWGSSFS